MAPDAHHPTRTLTRTRTLWGDLCLDAVAACEGSRLIRPKGMLWMGGAYFKTRAPGCAYNIFAFNCICRSRSSNPAKSTTTSYSCKIVFSVSVRTSSCVNHIQIPCWEFVRNSKIIGRIRSKHLRVNQWIFQPFFALSAWWVCSSH